MRRVALFGGSFDPPHRGHVTIARAAADAFGLDRVLFAPVGRQPLKPEGAWATFAQRLAMCELACGADGRFRATDVDGPRGDGGANFTWRTLELVAAEVGSEARVFNLVGGDSFRTLGRWARPERLLEVAEWIVVSRPGVAMGDPEGMRLTREQRARVHWLPDVLEDVSATELRERLRAGEDCGELLPAGVGEYIRREGLYRSALPGALAGVGAVG